MTSAVVGAALGAAVGGAASDRWGRKPVLLAADALFAVGAALMAAAPGVAVLIAGASSAAPAVAVRRGSAVRVGMYSLPQLLANSRRMR